MVLEEIKTQAEAVICVLEDQEVEYPVLEMPSEYQGPALTLARLTGEIRGNTILGQAIVRQNYPHIDSPADE